MPEKSKILFVLNEGAGNGSTDWQKEINEYFKDKPHEVEFLKLEKQMDKEELKKKIMNSGAGRVVSVGGDGTFALLGSVLLHESPVLGLLRGGSANGMAKELEIPANTTKALDVITGNEIIKMDAVKINGELSFHLSDVGLNALIIKYFDESRFRGMWTYARMLFKALFNHRLMRVHIKTDETEKTFSAYMIVFANASKYGTGAVINPDSSISDGLFELVVVRKIAFSELVKLFWKHKGFNSQKVEIIEAKTATVTSKKRVHFQVDGQYLGKTKKVEAEIIPGCLKVLLPKESEGS